MFTVVTRGVVPLVTEGVEVVDVAAERVLVRV